MVTLTINGKSISTQEGNSVLEAAKEHGVVIPTLCYHKDLSPVGSCRLCLVEIEGWSGQVAACTLPVSEGISVLTETPGLKSARKMTLELLLQNYYDAGEDRIETEFMHWVDHYGASLPEGVEVKPRYKVDSDPNPFVWVDMNKCILCTLCVRACSEIQGRFVLGVAGRGHESRIIAGADATMLGARCESCGACVVYCPTGALDHRLSIGLGICLTEKFLIYGARIL